MSGVKHGWESHHWDPDDFINAEVPEPRFGDTAWFQVKYQDGSVRTILFTYNAGGNWVGDLGATSGVIGVRACMTKLH